MADAPAGFVPVFAGWNVWDVWQADDPDVSVLSWLWDLGVSHDRELQIWVEDAIKTGAPGAAVADPANPLALRGDQVQIIPHPAGLIVGMTRAEIPALAGALQVGTESSKATLRTVRFFNRGTVAVLPWPHDRNFVLDAVYVPSPSNPITNAPAPSSLGGVASEAANAVGHGLEVLAWVVGGAALLVALSKLGKGRS